MPEEEPTPELLELEEEELLELEDELLEEELDDDELLELDDDELEFPVYFRDTLQTHGFTIRTVKTGFKDFTDCHRARSVSRGDVEQLLAGGKTK